MHASMITVTMLVALDEPGECRIDRHKSSSATVFQSTCTSWASTRRRSLVALLSGKKRDISVCSARANVQSCCATVLAILTTLSAAFLRQSACRSASLLPFSRPSKTIRAAASSASADGAQAGVLSKISTSRGEMRSGAEEGARDMPLQKFGEPETLGSEVESAEALLCIGMPIGTIVSSTVGSVCRLHGRGETLAVEGARDSARAREGDAWRSLGRRREMSSPALGAGAVAKPALGVAATLITSNVAPSS